MSKIITVYFSIKGQTIGPGMTITNQEKGNTQMAAEFIHSAVGGDLFEIEAAKDYPEDHMELIDIAKKELNSHTRVEVKNYPDNFEEYDTVFFGYPNWWNTMPMVMFTFLEHFDWTGKRLIPFCTSEGSGFGSSIGDIKSATQNADVKDGISLKGSQVKTMESKISDWAKGQI